jgi:outer membrane cobalamin receptor
MRASNGLRQSRSRGYISGNVDERLGATRVDVTARLDAVEGSGVLPSFTLGASRQFLGSEGSRSPRMEVRTRVGQAVRIPTLYDLYFSSPQRVTVRALRAERVTYDAELGTTLELQRPRQTVLLSASLVSRRVRDAIVWFPGNFSWSPANVGVEQMHGVESQLRVARGPVAIDGWFSFYDSWLTTGALRIPTPYVSREAAGLRLTLQSGATTLSSNTRVLGPRPFTVGPRDPQFVLPGVALADVALSRHVPLMRFSTLLSLSIENIADQEWQSVRGFPEPGRRWSVALFLTPRSAR